MPKHTSSWTDVNSHPLEKQKDMGNILEKRGQMDEEIRLRKHFFSKLKFSPGSKLLEIGSGSGVVTRAIADHFGQDKLIYGLDTCKYFIDLSQKLNSQNNNHHYKNIQYIHGTATCLPFENNTLDAVFLITTFSHFTLTDRDIVLQEAYRVLKNNGKLIIVDNDLPSQIVGNHSYDIFQNMLSIFKLSKYELYMPRRLGYILDPHGFEILDYFFVNTVDRTHDSYSADLIRRGARFCFEQNFMSENLCKAIESEIEYRVKKNDFVITLTRVCCIAEKISQKYSKL